MDEKNLLSNEEKLLVTMLTERGYQAWFESVNMDNERGLTPEMRLACSNMRIAHSYIMAAKIRIAEIALGVTLSGEKRRNESSHLANIESDEDFSIQLGLVLKAMHETPKDKDWSERVAVAAVNAVGVEAEKWAEIIKQRNPDAQGRNQG